MAFKLATPFMETFEELNKLTEAADINASKKFWAAARALKIDEEAFHAAFDDELKELGLMDMFNAEGVLTDDYGRIKAAKDENPDSWALKALGKLWALRYKHGVRFLSEIAAEQEARKRWEDQKLRKAEEARAAKEAKLAEYQELLKTYLSKVNYRTVDAYEQAAGVSAVESITLVYKGEKPPKTWRDDPIALYSIRISGWGTSSYVITEADILVEDIMVKYLETHLRRAAQDIHRKAATIDFKKIDVFAANKNAEAILLGESGTLYEVGANGFGELMISVNGEKAVPVYKIEEPYEVIYTRVYWSDGNHRTTRDSESATYYSWNSNYADKLIRYIPTKFTRTDSYLGGYSDTQRITNPHSARYSRADGIDSWAVTHTVVGATD